MEAGTSSGRLGAGQQIGIKAFRQEVGRDRQATGSKPGAHQSECRLVARHMATSTIW